MNGVKEKIEKLLNLSMSDNEHEAKIALERAMKLMSEHNITKDEVYKQQMVSMDIELNYKRVPDWASLLYTNMAYISGCHFVWNNGHFYNAKGRIVGRERDVENAMYLTAFLTREVEAKSKAYRADARYRGARLAKAVKSFKVGMIERVAERIFIQKNQFFNEAKGQGLVCIDLATRLNDAMEHLKSSDRKITQIKVKNNYENEAKKAGVTEADKIDINVAVSKQKNIKQISA